MRRTLAIVLIVGATVLMGSQLTFAQPQPLPPVPTASGPRIPSILKPRAPALSSNVRPSPSPLVDVVVQPRGEGDEDHGAEPEEKLAPINWIYGFLGEKEGVEPGILFRPKGMPIPFLANIFNAAILLFVGYRLTRAPLAEGLKKRKEAFESQAIEAKKTHDEAAARLSEYKERMERLAADGDRIKDEYDAQAKRDRERMIHEAEEKREALNREAVLILDQEARQKQHDLLKATVEAAAKQAEELVRKQLTQADQERLAEEYLKQLMGPNALTRSGANS